MAAAVITHNHVHTSEHKGRRRNSAAIEEPMPSKSDIVRESPEVRRQMVAVTGALWTKRRLALAGGYNATRPCRCAATQRCLQCNLDSTSVPPELDPDPDPDPDPEPEPEPEPKGVTQERLEAAKLAAFQANDFSSLPYIQAQLDALEGTNEG